MKVITFYSYKGGVGRTLAASNFAVYLAKLGLKTVVIDFDLEAPGINAKFGLPELSSNQKGLLDYILLFQQTNQAMESLQDILIPVPLDNTEKTTLWLIPAGQYLSENYYRQLNQLDWRVVFSEERDGVGFFQQFLARLKSELNADFVIIDSRTGITEIAGLCTQQLADEVVVLSSLSSESIQFTKHIKKLIQNSQISKALGKNIDIKVVVSRVPKPDDLLGFKDKYCQIFETPEDKLFFLFSCPALELSEFLAISKPDTNEELVNNYVTLFYALDLEIAKDKIIAEIEKVSQGILRLSPEEAEQKIIQLTTMYPDPEAYRAAMRFFRLRRQDNKMKLFAWKLFDSLPSPSDDEVQVILAESYLTTAKSFYTTKKELPDLFLINAIKAIEPLHLNNLLEIEKILIYAQLLVDKKEYDKGLRVVSEFCEDEQLSYELRYDFCSLASRCAYGLEEWKLYTEFDEKAKSLLVEDMPF
ncbi:MAG: chromosome partitioning protein [Snowella sp.]|jgi:MinD-like ATPase involved in chromosome partitioning or flagellar assembly|nr:MAG: chromosome partitioning protein [Snowella sp.]